MEGCFASTVVGSSEQEMSIPYKRREDSAPQEAGEKFLNIGREQIPLLSSTWAIRRSRTYGLVILISVPGKEIEQPILETLSKLMKDRKMTGSSQNGFTKGKSCLTNMTAFQNMATSSVDVAYLAFIRLLTPVALQRKALGNLWTLS